MNRRLLAAAIGTVLLVPAGSATATAGTHRQHFEYSNGVVGHIEVQSAGEERPGDTVYLAVGPSSRSKDEYCVKGKYYPFFNEKTGRVGGVIRGKVVNHKGKLVNRKIKVKVWQQLPPSGAGRRGPVNFKVYKSGGVKFRSGGVPRWPDQIDGVELESHYEFTEGCFEK